jgi:murein DD-endopeptidase MepM/ murein hydrolase activator NlpD
MMTVKTALRGKRAKALIALAISIVCLGVVPAGPALAADYPSWTDVQNARASVAATAAEVDRITGLIAALDAAVVAAEAVALEKGEAFTQAQERSDAAQFRWQQLDSQADAAKEKAANSQRRAGQLAAELARFGGQDPSASLFFDPADSKGALARLGLATMVKDRSAAVYEVAVQQRNTARALTDQAEVAKAARQKQAAAAEAALQAAIAASQRAEAAVAEQQQNEDRLEAQKAALVQNQAITEASYAAGVAERARQAAVAAAAAAVAAAASGRSSAAAGAGVVGGQGWARPSGGTIGSNFALIRANPVDGGLRPHTGTDLQAGCGTPIYAAHAGTVQLTAFSHSNYGNQVRIDHGGGVVTVYAHIVDGGTLVSRGQGVAAGQQIARVGKTGNATGCHLHFEVRLNGVATDAVPFMRARGVDIAR